MKAIVVVSGGVDSTTLLYHVVDLGYEPIVITYLYGQKHSIERWYADTTCKQLGVRQIVITLPRLPGSSLTEEGVDIPKEDYSVETQKLTVVPNRNMVMLSVAASYAIALGIEKVFYAAHFNDEAVYPDCTARFVVAMNMALERGNYEKVEVKAPFIAWKKSMIIERGVELGVPYENTWSCYDPVVLNSIRGEEYPNNLRTPETVHCGVCGTCRERKIAFKIAEVEDPTVYAR